MSPEGLEGMAQRMASKATQEMFACHRGRIDHIRHPRPGNKDTVIRGWACADQGDEPLTVELVVGDIVLRRQRAALTRHDLPPSHPGHAHGFRFQIGGALAKMLPAGSEVGVRVSGLPHLLPPGEGVEPALQRARGDDNGDGLREMLKGGWMVNQWGHLKQPFGSKPELKQIYVDLYDRWRSILHGTAGVDLYLIAGNLLGLVREGGFLPHDDDIDAAFCVRAATPEQAADRFYALFDRISPIVREAGFGVTLRQTGQFHVIDGDGHKLSIFMSWLTPDGHYYRRIAKGGHLGFTEMALSEKDYLGRKVLIPEQAERKLDLVYGPNWRTPDLGYVSHPSPETERVIRRLGLAGKERLAERLKKKAKTRQVEETR